MPHDLDPKRQNVISSVTNGDTYARGGSDMSEHVDAACPLSILMNSAFVPLIFLTAEVLSFALS